MNWVMRAAENVLSHVPGSGKIPELARRVRAHSSKALQDSFYDLMLEGNSQQATKRALLSYILDSFKIPEDDPRFLRHINIWHSREMVRALNRMGYVVDVIDYRNTDFVPRRAYDLFIGHGGINFESIARTLQENCVKVYFSTGCYWRFHNEQELSRFEALRIRRGVVLEPDRLIRHSEEGALQVADGIIGIGNDATAGTYAGFSPVIMINGTALRDNHYEQADKDFASGTRHFVYYAGAGNVHKGLDLLLEAFAELDQHLWICSGIDKGVADAYSNELHRHRNIHLVGWVQPRSAEFYKVMRTCNYAILPSCSEGQAQSIVECMNQGLIPVVSKACGLDIANYGFLIELCTVEHIRNLVGKLASQYSAIDCQRRSLDARAAALGKYAETAFPKCFREAINLLINTKGA